MKLYALSALLAATFLLTAFSLEFLRYYDAESHLESVDFVGTTLVKRGDDYLLQHS